MKCSEAKLYDEALAFGGINYHLLIVLICRYTTEGGGLIRGGTASDYFSALLFGS